MVGYTQVSQEFNKSSRGWVHHNINTDPKMDGQTYISKLRNRKTFSDIYKQNMSDGYKDSR